MRSLPAPSWLEVASPPMRKLRESMIPQGPYRTWLVIVAVLVGAAAGCNHGSAIRAKDSGTTSPDLAPARDGIADQSPNRADADADASPGDADARPTILGGDDAVSDSTVGSDDAGPDGSISATDSAAANRDQVGGEPLVCQGSLPLGNYLPSTLSGSYSGPLALGDFNGDGKLDLVSHGRVLLGRGNGAFADPVAFAASGAVLALGDLDGDGKLDIVTAGDKVSVLLGKGDGTFATNVDYVCGKGARSVALADLNGDGKPDIVTANYDAATVTVLLGNGDGTFAASVDYPTGDGPSTVLVDDVNGDGEPDVVTVNVGWGTWSTSTVTVLLGTGTGKFADRLDTQGGGDPGAAVTAALGDLNGDGKLDLVVASSGSTKVLLGTGDGRFAAPLSGTWGTGEVWVGLSDLNGDGKLDVVVVMSAVVRVLRGRGDGTFAAAVDTPTSQDVVSAAMGDVNGDGKADLVVSMASGGTSSSVALGVLFGTGRGTFGTDLVYPTGSLPSSVALGDVNGDGTLDIVTASYGGGTVSVLMGKGGGTFAANVDYTVGKEPIAVALGDLDGDGSLDIVTANLAASDTSIASVSVLLGRGDGTFAAKKDFVTKNQPTSLALGDVNGDGKLDIVTANTESMSVEGTVNVLFGKGDGTFAASARFSAGYNTQAVALRDLNGDGTLDIVVANAGMDDYWSMTVMLGKGDGTFPSTVGCTPMAGVTSVALGDLNGDGSPDIVMASATWGGEVGVLLGKGDGTFAANVDNYGTSSGRVHSLVLGDLNGDGKLDVVTAGDSPGLISVLLGYGDGTLSSSMPFALDAAALALADLNGDGRPDIVALTGNGASILLNSCR